MHYKLFIPQSSRGEGGVRVSSVWAAFVMTFLFSGLPDSCRVDRITKRRLNAGFFRVAVVVLSGGRPRVHSHFVIELASSLIPEGDLIRIMLHLSTMRSQRSTICVAVCLKLLSNDD